jgi:hypothetical protein
VRFLPGCSLGIGGAADSYGRAIERDITAEVTRAAASMTAGMARSRLGCLTRRRQSRSANWDADVTADMERALAAWVLDVLHHSGRKFAAHFLSEAIEFRPCRWRTGSPSGPLAGVFLIELTACECPKRGRSGGRAASGRGYIKSDISCGRRRGQELDSRKPSRSLRGGVRVPPAGELAAMPDLVEPGSSEGGGESFLRLSNLDMLEAKLAVEPS